MPSRSRQVLSLGGITNSLTRRGGGLSAAMRDLCIDLLNHDVAVHAYGVADEFVTEDGPLWAPVESSAFPLIGPKRFGFAPKLRRAVEEARHDVLHQHGLWMYPSMISNAWRKKTGNPTVISPYGMLDPWALRNNSWKKRIASFLFEKGNLTHASCLHALQSSEAKNMRDLGISTPIAIIPSGVRLPAMIQPASPPEWIASEPRRVLLFLGRIHPKKGVDRLIEAWALLKGDHPHIAAQWVLAIAGWDDGGYEAGLRTLVRQNKLERDVLFIGPVFGSEKERTLRHASAFILPSHSEGLPIAVLEAWSYALPVFMTAACNIPSGFEVGAAFKISVQPAEIASGLAEHLDNTDALRAAGERGRELAASEFSWESIANEFASVYRWLADGGAQPKSIT